MVSFFSILSPLLPLTQLPHTCHCLTLTQIDVFSLYQFPFHPTLPHLHHLAFFLLSNFTLINFFFFIHVCVFSTCLLIPGWCSCIYVHSIYTFPPNKTSSSLTLEKLNTNQSFSLISFSYYKLPSFTSPS